MGNYTQRSTFFENVAISNKLIAHTHDLDGTGARNSFHRINDLEELLAACANWGHFPCVVHIDYEYRFKESQVGLPVKRIGNSLMFLAKLDLDTFPNKADAVMAAYDVAEDAMNQYIGFMREYYEQHGPCGEFLVFDLNQAKVEMSKVIVDTLFGWLLKFNDDRTARELAFDQGNYFTDVYFNNI
jgi:hypothetical protein